MIRKRPSPGALNRAGDPLAADPYKLTWVTDTMKQIWSPWRMKYIMRHERTPGCIFCNAIKGNDDPKDLVIWRGNKVFVILNRYPYTSGHLMVVPNAHQPSLSSLDDETRCEVIAVLSRSERVIRQVYHPEGFNIGANLGAAAGAGVAGHIHFHVVPRWSGDTNFMTTLADARVLPENLSDTYQRLVDAWNSLPE
jgi:ATP adenylyltransferase